MDNQIIYFILIPTLSALIGWLTNWIALKSIFKPYKPINLFFFKFQGVIPKRKKIITKKISQTISEYLISHQDLIYEFRKEENIEKIKKRVIPIFREKILSAVPTMLKPMAEPLIESILLKESREIILKIGDELFKHFEETIDIEKLIEEKLNAYSTKNLEKIIYKIAKTEFKHIEKLGAIIGFLIGLIQIGLISIL